MKINSCYFMVLCLWLLGASYCQAQHSIKEIDSLLALAQQPSHSKYATELAKKAYEFSKSIGYNEGVIKSLILLASEKLNAGEYKEALKLIAEAEPLTTEVVDALYPTQVLILKGQIYTKLGFYKDGKNALLEAIYKGKKINERDKQHNSLGITYGSLAINAQKSGSSRDSAFAFIKKSDVEFSQIKNKAKYSKGMNMASYNLGVAFESSKRYDSAEAYYKKAILIRDNNNITAAALNSLGKLQYQQEKYTTAITYYEQAEKVSTELKNIYQLKRTYSGLSEIFVVLNDNKKAATYLKLSEKLGDSINKIEKAAVQGPLSNIVTQKEQLIAKSENRTSWVIVISSALLLIVVCFIFLYRYQLKKERKESEVRISELIKKIDENKENRSPKKVEELKEVVQLVTQNHPSFYLKFNDFDPDFGKKLNDLAPNLVASEVEFCAMLKLNLETKEIARYTKSSVRSVESKKYRVRKKLGILPQQDIYLWMASI